METMRKSNKDLRENTSVPRKLPSQAANPNLSSSSRQIMGKLSLEALDNSTKEALGQLVDQINHSMKDSALEVVDLLEVCVQKFLTDLNNIKKRITQSKLVGSNFSLPEVMVQTPASSGSMIMKEKINSGIPTQRAAFTPVPPVPAVIVAPEKSKIVTEKASQPQPIKEREPRDRLEREARDRELREQRELAKSGIRAVPLSEQPPQMTTRRSRGISGSASGIAVSNVTSGTLVVTGTSGSGRRAIAANLAANSFGINANINSINRPARKTSRRGKARDSSSEKFRTYNSSPEEVDSEKSDRGRKLIVKAADLNNRKKRGRKARPSGDIPSNLGKRVLSRNKPDNVPDNEEKDTVKEARKESTLIQKENTPKESKEAREFKEAQRETLTVIRETKDPAKEQATPSKANPGFKKVMQAPREIPDKGTQDEPSVAIIPNPSTNSSRISTIAPEIAIPTPRLSSVGLSLHRRKQIQKENEELSKIEESCRVEIAALNKPFKPVVISDAKSASEVESGANPASGNTLNPTQDSLDVGGSRRRLKKNSKAKHGQDEEDADQTPDDVMVTKESLNFTPENLEDSVVVNVGGRPKIGGMARRSKLSSQMTGSTSANPNNSSKSLVNLLDHTAMAGSLAGISTEANSNSVAPGATDDELAKRKPQHYTLEAFFYKQGAYKPSSAASRDPSMSKVRTEKSESRVSVGGGSSMVQGASGSVASGAETVYGEQRSSRQIAGPSAGQAPPEKAGVSNNTNRRSNSSTKGTQSKDNSDLQRLLDMAIPSGRTPN